MLPEAHGQRRGGTTGAQGDKYLVRVMRAIIRIVTMIISDANRPEIGYADGTQEKQSGNPFWNTPHQSTILPRHIVTSGNVAQSLREERAFYNATGDPHIFPTDTFIGRARELAELQTAIDEAPGRLVAVLGPAGAGKTRLALETMRTADERYPGGALVVRLAAIERPSDIVPEIARAMGVIDQAEKLDTLVREELGAAPSVLLLDCYEHLTPFANSVVGDLLANCPELHIVLTSRRSSGLPDEWGLELAPLPVAATDAALPSDAAQLFLTRALKANERFRVRPDDLPIIEAICARYDGLPLAIELMASWVTVLSPRELLEWKPDQLEFRTPVADPRHQSLLDAIAWSFGLLRPDEQTLLCRLAIFSGGFSRDQVEAMARGRQAGAGYPFADGYGLEWPFDRHDKGNPTLSPWGDQDPAIAQALSALSTDAVRMLANLVDHRLVYQAGEIDGVPRFDMLEAIREFGRRQLERTDQLAAVQHAHAAAMMAFSGASSEGLWNRIHRLWSRERIDAELQNIRSALAWASELGDAGAEIRARVAGPIWPYWQTRGMVSEGRAYLEDSLFRPTVPLWCRGNELPALAFLCWIQGDDQRCQEVVQEALVVTERTGITNTRGTAYLVLALLEFRKGLENVFTMLEYVEEAERLFEHWGDPIGLGACNLVFGQVCRLTGNTDQALALFDRAFSTHEEIGYEWGAAAGRYFAAEAVRDLAEADPTRIPEAVALLHDALQRFWNIGDYWGAGGAMSGLACIAAMQGVDQQAATYFGAAGVLMGRVGGSLLPSELMTHLETEAELKERMAPVAWQHAYTAGAEAPDKVVEAPLADSAELPHRIPGAAQPALRLTRRQMTIVQDLAQGYDIPTIANRRGRSVSATYELVDRILKRLALNDRDDIAPFAVKQGLVRAPQPRPGFIPPK